MQDKHVTVDSCSDLKDVCGLHATLFHVLSLNASSVSLPEPLIGWTLVNTHTKLHQQAHTSISC